MKMSTKRELALDALNDRLQQMPVRGERKSEQWFSDWADVSTWLHQQRLPDLRGMVDLNGEDPEGMDRNWCIARLMKGKGF
jgi:hypothetical protein